MPEEPERAAIAIAAAKRQETELGPRTAAYIAERTDKYSAAATPVLVEIDVAGWAHFLALETAAP